MATRFQFGFDLQLILLSCFDFRSECLLLQYVRRNELRAGSASLAGTFDNESVESPSIRHMVTTA
jgi:hypothetical protein